MEFRYAFSVCIFCEHPILSVLRHNLLTKKLEVDPDLVHAPCSRPAEDDGGGPVEADALELGVAVLAVGRHLAHADLVAHHLDRLFAVDHAAEMEGKKHI